MGNQQDKLTDQRDYELQFEEEDEDRPMISTSKSEYIDISSSVKTYSRK